MREGRENSSGEQRRSSRLSVTETARELGISRWTVRRMVDAGELDAIDVRGMLRIERASVEAYISEHRHNGKGRDA